MIACLHTLKSQCSQLLFLTNATPTRAIHHTSEHRSTSCFIYPDAYTISCDVIMCVMIDGVVGGGCCSGLGFFRGWCRCAGGGTLRHDVGNKELHHTQAHSTHHAHIHDQPTSMHLLWCHHVCHDRAGRRGRMLQCVWIFSGQVQMWMCWWMRVWK